VAIDVPFVFKTAGKKQVKIPIIYFELFYSYAKYTNFKHFPPDRLQEQAKYRQVKNEGRAFK
jgi:hypothetical protein